MDTQPIYLALIVAIPTILSATVSPIIMSLINNRNRRKEKQEDYARQDAVAEQAAKAAKLLVAANERVADTAKVTNGKLDVIHTLVNSNMTAAMQAELDARLENLALLLEVVEMKRAAGHSPNEETLVLIETTKRKITELKSSLGDRLKQSSEAEKIRQT